MTVKIRLSRAGRVRQPYYHVVVQDGRMKRDGRFIERVGKYNPLLEDKSARVQLNGERINHWLSVGAQPSERVSKFLISEGLGTDKQRKKWQGSIDHKARLVERKKAAEAEKKAAEEAAAKAEEEAAAAEATAEEAPAAEAAAEEAKTEEAPAKQAAEETPAEEEAKTE